MRSGSQVLSLNVISYIFRQAVAASMKDATCVRKKASRELKHMFTMKTCLSFTEIKIGLMSSTLDLAGK